MDDIFARCVDVIALAGESGISLPKCVERVLDTPRPALVLWLYRNCKKREPCLFEVKGNDYQTATVVASRPLRERALGFSSLEHAVLQNEGWRILEAVGQAGRDGALQSQLSKDLNIGAVMLHHYLGSLLALKLVVRRKIVLTTQRRHEGSTFATSAAAFANVTQTCVITLARYAASIGTATAANAVGTGRDAHSAREKSVIYNIDLEERTEKILEVLRETPGGIAPERDLKLIAIPDAVGNRHRLFRSIKEKIVKANLVRKVMRQCVDVNGESRGMLPCFALMKDERNPGTEVSPHVITGTVDFDDDIVEEEEKEDHVEEQASEDEKPNVRKHASMLFEVDIAEQVYRAFDKSGSRGMSCPEVVEMLDGKTGNTGIEYKRMRSLLNTMENTHSLKPLQHFNASACHKRFVLKEHHIEEGNDWPPDLADSETGGMKSSPCKPRSKIATGRGRTVSGNLTTLGTKRRSILDEVMKKENVVQADKIGRIIAEAEGSSKHVDVKVTRKIIDSMIESKLCRYVNVGKPRFGGSKTQGTMKLLVSSQVSDNGPEIRDFLSRLVKRTMAPADSRASNTPKPRKRKGKKRKSIPGQHDLLSTGNMPGSHNVEFQPTKAGLEPGLVDTEGPAASSRTKNESNCDAEENVARVVRFSDTDCKEKQDADMYSSSQVLVKTPTRSVNQRNPRLSKLRSSDYGFIRPRMRRARLLHEYLVQLVTCEEFFLPDTMGRKLSVSVTHSTIEMAGKTKDLGTFNYSHALKSMSVALFANLFGIVNDHGELNEQVKKLSISSAPQNIQQEINGRSSMEQARVLFSILWELGLVYSSSNTTWFLRGSGVYRDFGRGIPPENNSHSIIFNSKHAIDMFWQELESLSNTATVLATYVPDPQSTDLFVENILKKVGTYPDPDSGFSLAAELLHVYIPKHWFPTKSGNVRTVVEDEFIMEMVLQSIVVGWCDDGSMPKKITDWQQGVLPWVSVDKLYDSRFLLDKGYRRRRNRQLQMSDLEYFVQYARKRTHNRVTAKVIRLSQKPNNEISDYLWLQKAFPEHSLKNSKRPKSVDCKETPPMKKRRQRRNEPSNDEDSIYRRAVKKRFENGLLFEECALLLKLVTKLKALVAIWSQQAKILSYNEDNPILWTQITEAVEMPKSVCDEILDIVYANKFVSRYMKAVLDGLVNSLKAINISIEGDSQLLQVPGKIMDCFGQELSLEDAICAILEDSSVKFKEKAITAELAISISKRKSILRRLRSSMTGDGYNISTPPLLATTKIRETRSRIRLLHVQDSSENLSYGLIRHKDSDLNWISPYSTGKLMHSEGRRSIISLLVMAILDEPESDFDVRIVTYILSRFPVGEIIGMRNDLYRQERISILEEHRRAFRVDLTKKKPDFMFAEESHQAVHNAGLQIKSLSISSDDSAGLKLFRAVCSKEGEFVSQGTLAAAVQMFLFSKDENVNIKPRVRDRELYVEFLADKFGSTNIRSDPAQNVATETHTHVDVYQFMQCQTQSDDVVSEQVRSCDGNSTTVPCDVEFRLKKNSGNSIEGKSLNCSKRFKKPKKGLLHINEKTKNAEGEHNGALNSPLISSAMVGNLQGESSRCGALLSKGQESRDSNVCDEDRFRLEAEWIQETNIRRLRERNTLSYYKSQKQPVFAAILEWVLDSESKGLSSYDIGSRAAEHGFSGDQIVLTIVELIKEGVLHRFGCGNALEHGERAPAIYMALSYAWVVAVAPVSESNGRNLTFDWGRARPISPWIRVNGQFNTKLVEIAQVHVLNVAAKRPGVEETHLVASVISREPILSERAVLDTIAALLRSGRLKRTLHSTEKRLTIFSSKPLEVPECTISKYPDGFELAGQIRMVKCFYSASGANAVGILLSGQELDSVAVNTPMD